MDSKNQFNDIFIEQYTERSIVVRGDTRKYKEDLKKLGGKYNSRLNGEPGWIFPKSKNSVISGFIFDGKRLVTEEEITAGEKRTVNWSNKDQDNKVSNDDYMKSILYKLEKLEIAIGLLLTEDQKNELMVNISEKKSKNVFKSSKTKNNILKEKEIVFDCDSGEDKITPRRRLLR